MGYIIHPIHGAVTAIYKGSTRISKIYKGSDLIWTADAAGLPEISSFTARATEDGRLWLRFEVSRSRHNVITLDGQNVPLTSDTGTVFRDPGPGDHTYVLTASNAAGAVSRRATYSHYTRPTLENFTVRYCRLPRRDERVFFGGLDRMAEARVYD